MNHGSGYLSDHFQNQIKYRGIAPGFAFGSQPQTNGAAERFFRTLKEQAVYGRTFRDVQEVRQAVADLVEACNHSRRPERPGYLSPVQYRKSCSLKQAA